MKKVEPDIMLSQFKSMNNYMHNTFQSRVIVLAHPSIVVFNAHIHVKY